MEEEEEHDELMEGVVKRLAENNLYMKLEKCKWKMKEVGFLGVVIEPKGIKMEEEKMKDVLDWPIPRKVKNIQKFLRLANYYFQFIKGFATIARPLHNLVKEEQKWEWTERQENTFKKLKKRFVKKLVLVAPDLDKKIRMEVNMLNYAMEGVLSIECEDMLWRLVLFLSKSLNEIERN